MIRLLGARHDLSNVYGRTALHICCMTNTHAECIVDLVEYGADPNQPTQSDNEEDYHAVEYAVQNEEGVEVCVEALLGACAFYKKNVDT